MFADVNGSLGLLTAIVTQLLHIKNMNDSRVDADQETGFKLVQHR